MTSTAAATTTPHKTPPAAMQEPPANSRRRFPLRLARYLLGGFIGPLAGVMITISAVVLLLVVFDDMSDFSEVEIPTRVMLTYFAARMPETLLTAIPISALLSICLVTLLLRKSNELTAIRACGVSLLTVASPLFAVVLLLCGMSLAINEVIIPVADEYVRTVQQQYLEGGTKKSTKNPPKNNKKPAHKDHLVYYSPRYQREWFFVAFKKDGQSTGVTLRQYQKDGRTQSLLIAHHAQYLPEERSWRFTDGAIIPYQYQDAIPQQLPPQNFQEKILPLRDTPQQIATGFTPVEKLNIRELRRMQRNGVKQLSPRIQRLCDSMLAYRVVIPLAPMIAAMLGFGLTITQGRRGAAAGLILAIALYMGYSILAQFALVLGKGGHIPAILAGATPTLLTLAAALGLAYKRQ